MQPFLAPARWETYRIEADKTGASAERLYIWNGQIAAALFEVLGHLECALREALDGQLQVWNSAQDSRRFSLGVRPSPEWAVPDYAAAPHRGLVAKSCRDAAGRVRKRGKPSHDDVVAQLSFGVWVKLIPKSSKNTVSNQSRMWDEALAEAFPALGERGPEFIYRRLARLRDLRNRIAHHENLLAVNLDARLSDILAILASIDQSLADHVAGIARVRETAALDPRA